MTRSVPHPAVLFILFGFQFHRCDLLAVDVVLEMNECHKYAAGAEAPAVRQLPAMTTQFVPSSQTSVAHAPADAARMAVPAVPEVRGLTFDDAEIRV